MNTTFPMAKFFMLLATLLVFAAPTSVLAHARLVKSSPGDKAALASSPEKIDLWFNELLDSGFNTIEIFAAAEIKSKQRTNLAQGEAVVDAKDKTHLSAGLKALPPGEYVIEYRVLSRDSHSAPGRIRFSVSAAK